MRTMAIICLGMLATLAVSAHPGHDDAQPLLLASAENVDPTGASSPVSQVTISIEGSQRVIRANGLPNHATGQFPSRGNPNRISPQSYEFRMSLTPQTNAITRPTHGAWFGVALNGVPYEPGTAEFWNGQREWVIEAKSGFINLGIDANNAHVQPTGAYHYHGLPTGLIQKLGGQAGKMLLVGYAADGFPIYTSLAHSIATNAASPLKRMHSSWQLKQGERDGGPGGKPDGKFTRDYEYMAGSGDLDECNGRYGIAPEYPNGTYYYCITDEFPQLARAWRGTPDPSFFKRDRAGRPGAMPPPDRRPPGR